MDKNTLTTTTTVIIFQWVTKILYNSWMTLTQEIISDSDVFYTK